MKSTDGILRFGDFTLDPANRRLSRGNQPIELGGRYLDALVMLASAPGQLVSKDRLHEEVWRGIPVTDEALSQAIMALRKALGDDAARPRFIETVPRHGYRFVASLREEREVLPLQQSKQTPSILATQGIMGAVAAGLLVGLVYGMAASQTNAGSALSLVLVLICVSVLAALVSGLGIAGGIGLATRRGTSPWLTIAGGTLGGLVVGGFARLLGSDTLRLLMGSAPERMAGAAEGLLVGTVVGLSVAYAARNRGTSKHALAALLGAGAGLIIIASGGTLMAGSLSALVQGFPGAGLTMAWTRDPLWMHLSGMFEGSVFVALVSAGLTARTMLLRGR